MTCGVNSSPGQQSKTRGGGGGRAGTRHGDEAKEATTGGDGRSKHRTSTMASGHDAEGERHVEEKGGAVEA